MLCGGAEAALATDLYWYFDTFFFRCDFFIGEMTAASGSATMEVRVASLWFAVLLTISKLRSEMVVVTSFDMLTIDGVVMFEKRTFEKPSRCA